ncbi:MAG: glycosyltransferase family 1 protein [Candidatus Moranbacteria bacterium]|nr:glycosyltransferase family 1 protein [Candidatus Moranbacteria bacterium]
MLIGIDGSRAFLNNRTGIEEYSYQVIKNMKSVLEGHQVLLYVRKNQTVDFPIPENWKVKKINLFRFWTQIGLAWEMFLRPVDVLFVPAHTVPWIHPEKTVVTVHGLEYEIMPQAYSMWERFYMRRSIINSCRWAKNIISVSENTKNDLMRLYEVPERKIQVIYDGYDRMTVLKSDAGRKVPEGKYLLFIGRLEERKNIRGIVNAFEILKERYGIPHKLVLAGRFGYGAEKIREEIRNSNCVHDVILPGFISEEEKWKLLESADIFLFPTFYEGFGIPVLEAQSAGVPVVAGNNSSIPEVVSSKRGSIGSADQKSALLVDVNNAEEIAEAAYGLISDENLRKNIIQGGLENVKRFSWKKCASQVADILAE